MVTLLSVNCDVLMWKWLFWSMKLGC